ncbi:hypothetical protein Syncc8109_0294 [Synechococcus sp. WH 8109]|nr:hypothetical protein Syncc8109_0294 [Synechococcus sp. WH 8109]
MGVVIHRCFEGGIGFCDGGTFAAGHRDVGILSIQGQMLARHAAKQNRGPLPGRQGVQPFDAQGDPVLSVGDQAR